jgi:hypothetical protein
VAEVLSSIAPAALMFVWVAGLGRALCIFFGDGEER